MAWALYLGCTVPVRNLNYEAAIRRTADKLGLGLKDIPDFGCCGFPLKSLSNDRALELAARNLALARREDCDNRGRVQCLRGHPGRGRPCIVRTARPERRGEPQT